MNDQGKLVLTRKAQEKVCLLGPGGENLATVEVLRVRGGRVQLRFVAPRTITIVRWENTAEAWLCGGIDDGQS